MKTLFSLAFVLFPLVAFAQKATVKIESIVGPKPYTSLDLNNDPKNFQFAIVTDRTGGHRPGVFLDGVKKLNLLQPEFVMSVGDLIEGYTTDTARLNREWAEFNGFIDQLEMPFFYVPGNHDITNKVMEEKWLELYGKTYYSFVYQDVLFMCLNSEDNYRGSSRGTIGDEQYEWIKKTLAENQDVKWTLMFLHQPLWAQSAETLRWPDVEKLLTNRKHTVYAGHRHRYVQYEQNNGKYYVLATTGGGSPLRGPELGEFDHVIWITMTDGGPIMANLQLEGIWPEDMVTDKSKEYFVPLVDNNPLKIEPILVESNGFKQGKLNMKLTNDSDVPMTANLSFEYNTQLLPSTASATYEVAPNSVEMIEWDLESRASIEELNSLKINTSVTYTSDKWPVVKADFSNRIKPEKIEKLTKASITVDGKLNDWEGTFLNSKDEFLVANPFSHSGNEDASFTFKTAYDDAFFYVGVMAKDDELMAEKSGVPWRQDGLEVFIDARPLDIAATGTGGNQTLIVSTSPYTDGSLNTRVYRAARLPKGTKVATQQTDNGFIVELAIPLSYIKEKQGENWSSVRVNVAQYDFDSNNHRSTLWWRPRWNNEASYVGSGMFRK